MDLVPFIYFEKQKEDNLCAQYALNMLLQGNYFTAVDLGEIGRNLDQEEQFVGGRKQGSESQNLDDSGYFSIQVLQKALEIWNLELIPWQSKEMEEVRKRPEEQVAFICNLQNHWFTLRKFSEKTFRWYNLNSMQSAPTYLGEHIALTLQDIVKEGCSVFVVKGSLSMSEADRKAETMPKPLLENGRNNTPVPTLVPFSGKGYSLSSTQRVEENEEAQLARVIQESLKTASTAASKRYIDDQDEIRRKRLARFELKK